ncbi:MAG: tyrosine-type recombinase/integrase [Actinomycetota bacterium]|nr:tyrosine-type recombinase/integrase [Actinomycetota bacterium]
MDRKMDLFSLGDEYLQLRRQLGFKLVTFSKGLHSFLKYMAANHATVLTTDLAVQWAMNAPRSTDRYTWGRRLMIVRIFARYAHSCDDRHEVPPQDILPCPTRRALPYIYSDAEIRALMDAAGRMRPPFRGLTLATFIGLLAVTGMRTGEAHRLNLEDLDLANGIIRIHDAKFNKSRDLPIHPTTVAALSSYLLHRAEFLGKDGPMAAVFLDTLKHRLRDHGVTLYMGHFLEAAGIVPVGRPRPRLHDLRHAFATETLLRWYAEGRDVPASMPLLSTYLGHVDPQATYWYLTGTTELMGLAEAQLSSAVEKRRES